MKTYRWHVLVLMYATLSIGGRVRAESARNPIIWADVPDVAAIRVGDTYYMSFTTMHMSPGLPILKSKDLVNWRLIGYAYDTLADNEALRLENGRNAYGAGSWASSLRYHDGTFYASTFSRTSGRTHVYTTKDIERGPWKEMAFAPSLHDHSLFFDDDGRVYMLYGVGNLRLVELEPDLSGIKKGGFNEVVIRDASAVAGRNIGLPAEGSQLRKINGKYYVMNITWPRGGMRTQLVHRADKITGPYEGKVVLQDKGVAQGCLIDTPDGKWYAVLFQDNGSVGRSPWLVPVKWEDGWPVLGIDGKAPTILDIDDNGQGVANIVTSDEFNRKPGEPLPLAWQWNHNPDNRYWSIGDRSGHLRLTTGRVDSGVLQARNTLTQRTFGPVSSASTKIEVDNMKDGDCAGLIALQRKYGFVGVKMEDGNKSIVMVSVKSGQRSRRSQPSQPVEIESIPLSQSTVYLKIDCDFRDRMDKAHFYYSLDGTTWTKIGSVLQMAYTLPHFMGYRFGLFNYATETAGGFVDFDYYHTGDQITGDAEIRADPLALTVHTDQITKTVSVGIYGQFLEHIFNSVHGGHWGDQILNGTLELRPSRPRRRMRSRNTTRVTTPRNWEFVGDANEVSIDRDSPFNADVSVRIATKVGGDSVTGPGIRQRNIAFKQGEMYTFSLYARGSGSVMVTFIDGDATVFSKTFTGLTARWQKFTVEFTSPRTVDASTLMISPSPSGSVNIDQISLFSASALATGGYRPDLFKAVADLQPASIRWPGGSFANRYIWQNGIGPREKRLPHPIDQWGDRDTYQFGTDEFIQFCEKVKAEPILVLNTSRGVEDALNWLEYCMGDETTEYGKMRAANGHPAPYQLKTLEIDNEPWLLMDYSRYLDIVNRFCPAIRARYPNLKLSVAGSYGYDTGPGEGNQKANRNWDPRIIADAGKLFDILSPHYYNGIYFKADHVGDPYKYEQFLKGRGEIIRESDNPDIKIYVSEWNLTNSRWGNDWRVGLYAGGILNAFERQGDMVTMSCPALFMRKQGVTNSWDNALINFDQKSWFPAGNYVVMKLWRDSFAPNLLAVDGPDRPLNFVATRSADKRTVFLKAVNPTGTAVKATIRFDGDLIPKAATMQLVAPGGETVKNSLDQPDNIKVAPAPATVENRTVKFTMPPLSAGVVRVTPRLFP